MAGEGLASTIKRTWRSGFKKQEVGSPDPAAQPPKCPECASNRVWRNGFRYNETGSSVQRYLCRDCGYRFSQPKVKVDVSGQVDKTFNPGPDLLNGRVVNADFPFKEVPNDPALPFCKDVASHRLTVVGKALYTFPSYNSKCRVRVSEGEAKNLAEVESQTRVGQRGATTKSSEADVKGKILEHAWWMKKEGYSEATIKSRTSLLRQLIKLGADLFNPESIKEVIANREGWGEGTKVQMVAAYSLFAQNNGITWAPPNYRQGQKLPFIPLETEIDQFIAGCGKKTATLLQLLKEGAMRVGEAWQLKWIDIDWERNTIRLNLPEKRGRPRIFKASAKLMGMLQSLPKDRERVFNGFMENARMNFIKQRRRIALKLQNPRLLQISFHTLRHWKATMLYHETKDLLYVMKFLGHRNVQSTLIYIDLERATFGLQGQEEFTVRVAKTLDEACQLLEVGFDYVCDMEGAKLFRKRK